MINLELASVHLVPLQVAIKKIVLLSKEMFVVLALFKKWSWKNLGRAPFLTGRSQITVEFRQ